MHSLQLVRAMKTVGFFDVNVVDYKARWEFKITAKSFTDVTQ